MTQSILFVCLGNICRSPTAEGIMRGLVQTAGADIEVDSAGTSGWHNGALPDRRSMAEAARRGYDLSAQRSRQVVQQDFARFDLILAMDRSNLHNLEAIAPSGAGGKLRLLLDYLPDQPLREVPDPYYEDGFDRVFDLIEAACRAVLADVAG
nr:low molecular weight protein-tyrosine-phosphatase [Amylibacter sp.]